MLCSGKEDLFKFIWSRGRYGRIVTRESGGYFCLSSQNALTPEIRRGTAARSGCSQAVRGQYASWYCTPSPLYSHVLIESWNRSVRHNHLSPVNGLYESHSLQSSLATVRWYFLCSNAGFTPPRVSCRLIARAPKKPAILTTVRARSDKASIQELHPEFSLATRSLVTSSILSAYPTTLHGAVTKQSSRWRTVPTR